MYYEFFCVFNSIKVNYILSFCLILFTLVSSFLVCLGSVVCQRLTLFLTSSSQIFVQFLRIFLVFDIFIHFVKEENLHLGC